MANGRKTIIQTMTH